MSAAADRAKSLARIAAVQAEMVKLAQWRLAAAERDRQALAEDRARLAGLVGGEEPLGAALARAALRSARSLDGRMADAERNVAAQREELARLRRRCSALDIIGVEAKTAARREGEAQDLARAMDAWLARTSLPQGLPSRLASFDPD